MVLFWRRVAADKLFALRCVSVRYRVGSFCGTPTPSKNTAGNGHSRSLAYRRQLLRVTIYYEVLNGVCTNTPSVSQRPVERAQWRGHFRRTEERIGTGHWPVGKLLLVLIQSDYGWNRLRRWFCKYFESVNSRKLVSWHFISVFFYFLNKFCTKCLVSSGQIEKIAVL